MYKFVGLQSNACMPNCTPLCLKNFAISSWTPCTIIKDPKESVDPSLGNPTDNSLGPGLLSDVLNMQAPGLQICI